MRSSSFSPSISGSTSPPGSRSEGSDRIAGITVKGMLAGPSPFHVRGEGCLRLFVFDVCVPFDETFGERRQVELPAKDPWEELGKAIEDRRNWSPALPSNLFGGVSLKPSATDADRLLYHPMGRTSFRQKVIPLNKTLERFGEFAIQGTNRFDVAAIRIGDDPACGFDLVQDYMAPALSEELSDREKVSRDSYELEAVGVEVGSARAEFGPGKTQVVNYEQRIVETPCRARLLDALFALPRESQLTLSRIGAKALSLVNRTGRDKFAAPIDRETGVRLEDETWVIVEADTISETTQFGGATSKGQALRAYKEHIRAHPEDRTRLEVVSRFELREAA